MKKLFVVLTVALFATGCDLFSGAGGTVTKTPPPPVVSEWGNMVRVADTYDYAPPPVTLDQIIALGQIAATPSAVCVVVWQTANTVYAGCRNTESDGQWPAGCIADAVTGIVTCSEYGSVSFFFLSALGPARTLTTAEAELADEIRRKTICTAPRVDGSGNPCTQI